MENVFETVNSVANVSLESATNEARWTNELFNNRNAFKWLKNSFDGVTDPFLQLEILEEQLQERYGKQPKIHDQNTKMTYSEAVQSDTNTDNVKPGIGDFDKHTKGIGRRIMQRHGWKEGEGLGNGRKEGIKEPIETRGQTNTCKHGIGYEKVKRKNKGKKEEWKEVEGRRSKAKDKQEADRIRTENRYSPLMDGMEDICIMTEDEENEKPINFKRKNTETRGEGKKRRRAMKEAEQCRTAWNEELTDVDMPLEERTAPGKDAETDGEQQRALPTSIEATVQEEPEKIQLNGGQVTQERKGDEEKPEKKEQEIGQNHRGTNDSMVRKSSDTRTMTEKIILNPMLSPNQAVRSKERVVKKEKQDQSAAQPLINEENETAIFTSPFCGADIQTSQNDTKNEDLRHENMQTETSITGNDQSGMIMDQSETKQSQSCEQENKQQDERGDDQPNRQKDEQSGNQIIGGVMNKGEKKVTFDIKEPEVKWTPKQTKLECSTRIDRHPAVKMQNDRYEEWNTWKQTEKKRETPTKQQIVCSVCLDPTCESLARVKLIAAVNEDRENSEDKDSLQPTSTVNNILGCNAWTPLADDDRIKEKPEICDPDDVNGSKHSIIGIINNNFVVFVVDTGSFSSIVSFSKAKELNLQLQKLDEPINAKSATGPLWLKYETSALVDFGSLKCEIKMLVAEDPPWRSALMIMGSSTIVGLKAEINLNGNEVLINGIFPIPTFDNNTSMREYMKKIKRSYVSLSAIKVKIRKSITIEPYESTRIDVRLKLSDMEVESLTNTIVYFQGKTTKENCRFADSMVQQNYPWADEPLKVTVHNYSNRKKTIHEGEAVGCIKPLMNKEIIEELPVLNLENEVFLVEDIDWEDQDLVNEELIATLEKETERGNGQNDQNEQTEQLEEEEWSKIGEKNLSEMERMKQEAVQKMLQQAKEILKEKDGVLIPEMKTLPTKTQEELIAHFGIPSELKEEINVSNRESTKDKTSSRLTFRDDLTALEIDKLVEESQNERDVYWTQRGRNYLISQAKFGGLLTREQRQKVEDIIWEYRRTFVEETYHLRAAMKCFAAYFGSNDVERPHAVQRPGSKFAKELYNRYIVSLMRANVVKRSLNTPRCSSFLIPKPHPPPGTPEIKSLDDLTPDLTDAVLFKRYRLVSDLSKVNRCFDDFTYPMITPRQILSHFTRKNTVFFSLDISQCFFNLRVCNETSEQFLTFIGPGSSAAYRYNSTPMGGKNSMSLVAMALDLIYGPSMQKLQVTLIIYADNLICMVNDENVELLITAFKTICEQNLKWNVGLKASDISFGVFCNEKETTSVEILGLSIQQGRVQIPSRKKSKNADHTKIKTRAQLVTLLGLCSWYSNHSPLAASVMKLIRNEMRAFKARKNFLITERMEGLIKLLVELFVSSPGLGMVTDEEFKRCPILTLSDASHIGFGGTCLVLRPDDTLVPLRAHSRAWPQPLEKACSNRLELLATWLVSDAFEDLISMRRFFLLTDSRYAMAQLRKEIYDVPTRLRFPVLSLREKYDFRCLHLPGKFNGISDIMSRYMLVQPEDLPELRGRKKEFLKTHMTHSVMPNELADEIRENFKKFVDTNAPEWEQKIQDHCRMSIPTVLSIESEEHWMSTPCTGQDPCCLGDTEGMIAMIEGLDGLSMENKQTDRNKSVNTAARTKNERITSEMRLTADANAGAKANADANADAGSSEEIKATIRGLSELSMDSDRTDSNEAMVTERVTRSKSKVSENRKNIDTDANANAKQIIKKGESDQTKLRETKEAKTREPMRQRKSTQMETEGNTSAESSDNVFRSETEEYEVEECVYEAIKRYENCEEEKGHLGLNTFEKLEGGKVAIYRNAEAPIDPIHYLLHHVCDYVKEGDEKEVPEAIAEEWKNEMNEYEGENETEDENVLTHGRHNKKGDGSKAKGAKDLDIEVEMFDEVLFLADEDDSEKAEKWELDWSGQSIKSKVEKAQREDPTIQSYVNLLMIHKKPLIHEIQSRGALALALYENYEGLSILNGSLYIHSSDEYGDSIMTLVVPDGYATLLIKQIHYERLHTNTWRLLRGIANCYFIPNLKQAARQIQATCVDCALSANPVKAITRPIKTFFGSVGYACAIDILYLPPDKGYKYLCVSVDMATAFVMALPLKTKDGRTVANAIKDLQFRNHTLYKRWLSDPGREFTARLKEVAETMGAKHISINEAQKNALGMVESGNKRIVNLLRRTLKEGCEGWVHMLDQVIFALNSASFRYVKAKIISSPAYLHMARFPESMPSITGEDLSRRETAVRQIMAKIAKERHIDMPSIFVQVTERREQFKPGEKVLVHCEWVIAKRRSGKALYAKLRKFWCLASIIDVLPTAMYIIQENKSKKLRKVHARLVKRVPDEIIDKMLD